MLESFKNFDPPSQDNMSRVGSANFDIFIAAGNRIAISLAPYLDVLPHGSRILDLGVGVGRVMSQIQHNYSDILEIYGCDVDETATNYCKKAFPKVQTQLSNFNPPLPFKDNFFDAVYSISIWTHLCIEDQLPWLLETKRVLKPGGIALISTSGEAALTARIKRRDPHWESVTWEYMEKCGIKFVEYSEQALIENCPGIHSKYGLTLHHINWIKTNFGEHFKIIEFRTSEIDGVQDLLCMVKE